MRFFFNNAWKAVWITCLLTMALAGCGGNEARLPASSRPAVLPSPQALVNSRHAGSAVLYLDGSQYDPAVAQYASVSANWVVLKPNNYIIPPIDAMAYALFRFSTAGTTGAQTLTLDWRGTAPETANGWIGLGDWNKDRWDWVELPAGSELSLDEAQFAKYTNTDTGELLCLVSLTGGEPGTLQGLGFSPPPVPQPAGPWPMYGHDPQHTFRSENTATSVGNLKWTFTTTGPGIQILAPAIAPDGTVYVADRIYLTAYTPQGDVLWRFLPDATPGIPVLCPDGTVVIVSIQNESYDIPGYTLYALNPDGTVKWTKGNVFGGPVAGLDGAIYYSPTNPDRTEQLVCLNADGSLRWSLPKLNEITSIVGAVDGTAYYTDVAGLHAVDATGSPLWELPDLHYLELKFHPNGDIICWGHFDMVYSVDPAGTLNWSYEYLEHPIPAELAFAADGTVYVAYYSDGKIPAALCALTPEGGLLWSYEYANGFWNIAVLADGNICAQTHELHQQEQSSLICLNTSGESLWMTPLECGDSWNDAIVPLPDGGLVVTKSNIGAVHVWNPDGSIRWSKGSGGIPKYNPVVGQDGTVYIGCSDGTLYAVSPSGALVWSDYQYGRVVESPLLTGQAVYYSATQVIEDQNTLCALNYDGSPRWSYPAEQGGYISNPVLAPDGLVCYGAGRFASAVNFNCELQWSFDSAGSSDSMMQSPAVSADGMVYTSCKGTPQNSPFFCLDADGNMQWSYPGTPSYYDMKSAAIGADGTVYVCIPYSLYALAPDGSIKWSYTNASQHLYFGPALAADGTLYMTGLDNGITAINPDGTEKWNFVNYGLHCSVPAVDAAGKLYFTSRDRHVYCVDADGALVWSQPLDCVTYLGRSIMASPAIAADGTVYVGAGNKLYAFGD